MKFEGVTEENPSEKLPLQERLAQRDPHIKIAVVKENPGVGEITIDEMYAYDPEHQPGNSCAGALFVTMFSSNGKLTKEQLIRSLSESEVIDEDDEEKVHTEHTEEDIARATATVNNMIEAGLVQEHNGKLYLDMELVRK